MPGERTANRFSLEIVFAALLGAFSFSGAIGGYRQRVPSDFSLQLGYAPLSTLSGSNVGERAMSRSVPDKLGHVAV